MRARLAILLLVPLGCRGEFDIGQYLVGASESGEAESMDSGSTDLEPTDSESSDTDPTDTAETETTDTGGACASLQLELAQGCFGLLDSYELDVATTDLELADYTGDGQLDLLLAATEFQIMLGTPGGMFAGAMSVTGTSGIGVAAGQLDGIPAADFAAIDSDQIQLRISVGRGNFSDAGLIASGGVDAQFADRSMETSSPSSSSWVPTVSRSSRWRCRLRSSAWGSNRLVKIRARSMWATSMATESSMLRRPILPATTCRSCSATA